MHISGYFWLFWLFGVQNSVGKQDLPPKTAKIVCAECHFFVKNQDFWQPKRVIYQSNMSVFLIFKKKKICKKQNGRQFIKSMVFQFSKKLFFFDKNGGTNGRFTHGKVSENCMSKIKNVHKKIAIERGGRRFFDNPKF